MTDIPRNVMEEAQLVIARWMGDSSRRLADDIAIFALARDKRAAEIAQDLGDYIVADAILTYDTPAGQEDAP